ncbi:hypothetical protein GCM10017600_53620 [Streptosporangium carneum]|uniref:Lipoprotein n=2 Tax=Streptosporangium carneum TaxID=47481 RepID=A0A9W6I660_9ACTN|nr:hypothetical protein GCM10017600_53620 [Streptosporangium carneum]
MIAALAGAAVTALVLPVLVAAGPAGAQSAQAAPQATRTDPVSALKRQFRAHHGVKLAETAKLIGEGKGQRTVYARTRGVLEFDRTGVTATDLTSKFDLPSDAGETGDLFTASRTITVKGVSYISGGVFSDALPEGKKWLRDRDNTLTLLNPAQKLLNPLEPATLKATLAHTTAKRPGGTWDGARTVVHSGTITLGELYRISPTVRTLLGKKPSAKAAPLPVSWQLYIGSDQLVRRVVSSYTQSIRGLTSVDVVYLNDSRYSDWGAKSAIKAPPASQVADFDELRIGDKEAEEAYVQLFNG